MNTRTMYSVFLLIRLYQWIFWRWCALQCHCLNVTCNKTSGICLDTRCQPGWIGEFCSKGKIHNIAALSSKLKLHQND